MDSSGELGPHIGDTEPSVELLVGGLWDRGGVYAAYLSTLEAASLVQHRPGKLDPLGRGIEDNGSSPRLRRAGSTGTQCAGGGAPARPWTTMEVAG